jgi:hypothetical protein
MSVVTRYRVPYQEREDIAAEAVVRFLEYDAPRYNPVRSGENSYLTQRLRWRVKDAIRDWRCRNLDLPATEKKAMHLWDCDADQQTNISLLERYFLSLRLSATTAHRHATNIVMALAWEPTEILVDPSTIEQWDVQEDAEGA